MNAPMEPKRILVPVNGDESDEQAVRLACSLAKKSKGCVFILNVVEVRRNLPVDSPQPSDMERSESILERMDDIASQERCTAEAEVLQAREAGPALVDEAIERDVDLIIMGLSYKKHHGEFTLGDTVPYVLMKAPCRVWISREPMADDLSGLSIWTQQSGSRR